MKLSVITCTSDRPWAMARAEHQMARQTRQPDEWVVADDGVVPAVLTRGQVVTRGEPQQNGALSLSGNMQRALDLVTGDAVVIIEDDDWYHPRYLETCERRLAQVEATGDKTLRYYHVASRQYIVMGNRGSGLCQTSFVRALLPLMQQAVDLARKAGTYNIDGRFWSSLSPDRIRLHNDGQVVGIKGMPGKVGLGVGHRPRGNRPWQQDPQGRVLRNWVGSDADFYLDFARQNTLCNQG